eukprot:TRINITY_DN10954_c0_g1_i4.p1 TRINITY_DN10954_c0_g1~~TRINITY_DN10954_c0_g1_i4.p1  ORF type:complete len:258 (-),score=26.94 TRINITY_DN10954_c0_g1_i4:553-1326(-)
MLEEGERFEHDPEDCVSLLPGGDGISSTNRSILRASARVVPLLLATVLLLVAVRGQLVQRQGGLASANVSPSDGKLPLRNMYPRGNLSERVRLAEVLTSVERHNRQASCFFDVLQAIDYLGEGIIAIRSSVLNCPNVSMGEACVTTVSGAVEAVLRVAAALALAAAECGGTVNVPAMCLTRSASRGIWSRSFRRLRASETAVCSATTCSSISRWTLTASAVLRRWRHAFSRQRMPLLTSALQDSRSKAAPYPARRIA